MKLVAGLGTIEDYEAYVKAGADELFIGYVPYEWQREQEFHTPLNRREVAYVNVNIGSKSELEILAGMKDRRKVPVTIAINGLHYGTKQYPIILDIVRDCQRLGYQNVIVADPGLLIHLHESGLAGEIKIHVSGELGEMNVSQMALLEKLGVSRIIYHRATLLPDMKIMCEAFPHLEHEVFFLNEKCHFTGAYCNSLHCDYLVPMCRMPYELSGTIPKTQSQSMEETGPDGCALCALKKLEQMGVTHLKIVGRGASSERMLESIALARRALDMSGALQEEEAYRQAVLTQLMNGACQKQNCYYT